MNPTDELLKELARIEATSFNNNHPKLQEGEVFISNIWFEDSSDPKDSRTDWETIGWRTKRMGSIAYDSNGNVIPDACPVFAKRAEMRDAGVEPRR